MIMSVPLAAAIAAQLLMPIADRVPAFDVGPSCRGAARSALSPSRDAADCTRDEHRIRDTLAGTWLTFRAADRSHCVELAQAGGGPSYTELISCLESARLARQIRERGRGTSETVGRGT